MENLKYPGSEYLLDRSLQGLHKESLEWQKEIAFIKAEVKFLVHVIRERMEDRAFSRNQMAEMERLMMQLDTDELERMKNGLASHEKQLSVLFSNALLDEQVYRETHRKLDIEMKDLRSRWRAIKDDLLARQIGLTN